MGNRQYWTFSTTDAIAGANGARNLGITVGLFVFIIVCVLALDQYRTQNLNAIRAYVQAEGSWSKAQKEAVIELRRYVRSHEEKDYRGYLAALAIPLGDRQARTELEKNNVDLSIVYGGFLQGGNHRDDVKGMASLFLRFRNIRYMSDAIETWTQGDRYIVQLEGCAELLHAEIGSSRNDRRVIEDLLTQVDDIDARLTPLEYRFSEQMGAGARAISYFLSFLVFSFAALLVAGGITFSLFLAGRINESESDLLASEESYRQLVAKSPDAILVHRQGTIIFANSAFALLCGTSSTDELVGKQFLDFVDPGDRGTIEQQIQKYHNDLVHVRQGETNLLRPDGTKICTESIAHSVVCQGDAAVQVMFRDISEQQRAEQELRRSEANLAAAQRIAHLGSYEMYLSNPHEPEKNPLRWSDENFRIFGYEPGKIEVSGATFLSALHPDDRIRVREEIKKVIREEGQMNLECRIIWPSGTVRFIQSQSNVLHDEKTNTPVRLVGTVQDITERKRAEEGLRQYAAIVESSNDAIISRTLDGIITSWNAGAEQMFGFTPGEAIGKPITILASPGQSEGPLEVMAKIDSGKNVVNFETTRLRKDGKVIFVSLTVSPIKNEKGEIVGGSAILRDITEHKKAQERFYKAFNLSPEPMTIAIASEGRYVDVNESFLRVTGYQREEVIGRTSLELKIWEHPKDRARFAEILKEQGSVRDLEFSSRTKSGELWTALASGEGIVLAGEKCIIAILKDVTKQKLLEKQLRQSQKMEAIGQFSGGIAHDFNNLLGVIIGYSEVLEEGLDQGSRLRRNAEEIKKAGQRAASLTRQILAFSRQQVLEPKVLNLNTVVADTERMLRRLIGEHIELTTALTPEVGQVKADQGQIEQVIMNLAVNARDAMPDGGKLVIATENKKLDEEYALCHPTTVPGNYVMLSVTDTGIGMDAQTQTHIFEPFFTTKELGKGTGLGLATVYGVVKQSGGYIWVYSEPGLGSTFKIYLPRVDQAVQRNLLSDLATGSLRGSETVLLVEDEESLRTLTRTLLEQSGYTVLEADGGSQATEIARQHHGPIHLLLTDMVMPGMNGRAVVEKLMRIRPEMQVIYMSGYTGFTSSGVLDSEAIFLPKPVTRDVLLRKVHEVLSLQKELAAT